MVLVTCRRPLRPGFVSRMLCRSANSIGETSASLAMLAMRLRYWLYSFQRQRQAAGFIWLAATRPLAIWPAPDWPPGSVNHGRWAGAFIWVRTQMFDLLASELSFSINSRALLDSAGRVFSWTAISILLSIGPGRNRPLALLNRYIPRLLFATAGGQCRPAISSRGLDKIADRLGKLLRLLQVGKVARAFEFDHPGARYGLVDCLDPAYRGVLGADDQQCGIGNVRQPGSQVKIRQCGRAAGEALERRRLDHAAYLVEDRRLGSDELGREPARDGDIGEPRHPLVLGELDTL